MARQPLNYKQGDCFIVPSTRGQTLGVVAYLDGTGVIVAYFFLPPHRPGPVELATLMLKAEHAVLVTQLGDLALLSGAWPNLGPLPGWRREEWPLPRFFARQPNSCEARLRTYDEQTLENTEDRLATEEEIVGLPHDGLLGWKSVEMLLDKVPRVGPRRLQGAPAPPARRARSRRHQQV